MDHLLVCGSYRSMPVIRDWHCNGAGYIVPLRSCGLCLLSKSKKNIGNLVGIRAKYRLLVLLFGEIRGDS